MYDPQRLYNVLAERFREGNGVDDERLPDRHLIPATAMNGHDWYFVRDKARNAQHHGRGEADRRGGGIVLRADVFRPLAATVEGQALAFFDGGAGGLANPSYQTCVEMFEYDTFIPLERECLARYRLLSRTPEPRRRG